ncbi:MAG: trypsin-like serine protease [Gaiellaceae bacterium]
MPRPLRLTLVSTLTALTVATTALAVTGSTPDGNAHPYVGALVVDGAVQCSGVLIASTVFATAGHCGADGASVSVSLDAKLDDEWSFLEGTLEVAPGRKADLAVVVLDSPAGVAPATLPAAGSVESLARRSLVTSVGYGYSSRAADGSFVYDGLRRSAASPVKKSERLTLTISTREAGPCMGDSGGPQLVGDTVLSLTSTGSKDCSGKAQAYRLDSAPARAFLAGFVALP